MILHQESKTFIDDCNDNFQWIFTKMKNTYLSSQTGQLI